MIDRLNEIRKAEEESHTEIYTQKELFSEGSWLAKPVKTVMEALDLFDENTKDFRCLDLGCGVGRNCIPIAKKINNCKIDCIDILEIAIEKLIENAEKHEVKEKIKGIVAGIDEYEIENNYYDLIIAVSALEHSDSKEGFILKLKQICDGIRKGGVFCLIMNTNVKEKDKNSGEELPAQFEVNLSTGELKAIISDIFKGWEIIKQTVIHQVYDIPRGNIFATLDTDVVTVVMRMP